MAAETKSGRSRAALFLDFFMIVMQNAPPTDGTEQQHRKSDMELRPTATLQALVDDSNCDLEKLKLNPNDIDDEIMYQTL